MKCRNCNRELVKPGLLMADGTMCTSEQVDTKWLDGVEYIECKHCKAKNFIAANGPHTFTVTRFTVD